MVFAIWYWDTGYAALKIETARKSDRDSAVIALSRWSLRVLTLVPRAQMREGGCMCSLKTDL